MIARIWRGVVRTGSLAEYARYVHDTGVAEYARTPGNRGAEILTRDPGDGTAEILALSKWDGWDDVRRFAGDDAMVLYPEDERYPVGDAQLSHYDVASVGAGTTDVRAVAEAFSGHRFADAYESLAPDVT